MSSKHQAELTRILVLLDQAESLCKNLIEERADSAWIVNIPKEGVSLREVEREAILQALELTGWIQQSAAILLHISPRVMNHKIHHVHHLLPAKRKSR